MNVVVYCGSSLGADPAFREAARQLGTWIGRSGNRLVYGGSSVGLMGEVSRAVLEAGGEVDGVEPQFFIDAGVEQHDLTNLYVVRTMSERKAKMIELGDVFVALPGGVGTLEEISEIASRIRLGLGPDACFFLNIDGFYDPLAAQIRLMERQGFLAPEDVGRYRMVPSVGELVAQIAVLS